MHGVNSRQLQIISILKKCKNCTGADLQEKLGVSRRTIKMDIQYLKAAYPNNIITHRGRYNGGIEWID